MPHLGPHRSKKLIGTTLLILLVPSYALIVAAITASRVNEASAPVQALTYAFLGIAWVLPAGAIIKWMAGPRPEEPR